MKLEIRSVVPASRDATWALVMDIPQAAGCIPGIKDVTPDGEGRYQATLQARVGLHQEVGFAGIGVLGQNRYGPV